MNQRPHAGRQLTPLVCSALLLAGCGTEAHRAVTNSALKSSTQEITLRIADAEDYRETIAGLRGKVVLVDFWATWCGPCVEQFPHTVELHRKYKDRGLAVVSVSLDEPGDEPQVRDFLLRQDAEFENLLSKYGGGTKSIEAFGLPGPVPCYRVYDRSGELLHEFAIDPRAAKQFTAADVEVALAKAL